MELLNSERLYAEVNGKRKIVAWVAGKNHRITAKEPSKRFSGDAAPSPRFLYGFRFVCPLGRALGFGARERSERVTARRQPRRQRSRRLVYIPSARLTAICIFRCIFSHIEMA